MRLENKEVDLRCSETEALIQAKAGLIDLEFVSRIDLLLDPFDCVDP